MRKSAYHIDEDNSLSALSTGVERRRLLGIPNFVIGTALDIMSQVVIDWMIDKNALRTFGPLHDRQRNEPVLVKTPAELSRFTGSGEIRDIHWDRPLDGTHN
jgi:hypothetical protein